MMRITSSSKPPRSTPECATAELIDDIPVGYRTNALARRVGVINAESFTGLDSGDDDWDSDSDGGVTANFGFNVYRKDALSPVRGHLNYLNKATGEHVKSVTVDTLTITGNTATFSCTCTNNGVPCTFTVTVQDNGNPGKGNDTFQIDGMVIVHNQGTLSGGNIKIHQQK